MDGRMDGQKKARVPHETHKREYRISWFGGQMGRLESFGDMRKNNKTRGEFGQRAHFHTYLLAYLVALAEHIIVSPSKRIYQNIR